MYVMYLMVFGIAAFGGNFIKFNIFGIPFAYLTIAALFVSCVRFFFKNKGVLRLDKKSKAIITFELYGIIMVIFSIFGINMYFISNELYTNIAYIPRQAYYLAVLPAIILMREDIYIKPLKKIINKYGEYLFWMIYVIQILYTKRFAISVPTVLVLGGLALYSGGTIRTLNNLLKFVLIVFTPVAVGGELTNLIIRIVYASLFLFRNKKKRIIQIMTLTLTGMLMCIYILPLFSDALTSLLDANSSWRLLYWKDELSQLIKSHLLGVGYGTSYATENFVGQLGSITDGPFAATTEYSALDKLFVTGPHNSYVALAFRTGLLGITLFIYMMSSICKSIKKISQEILPVSVYLFFAVAILIGVNVGLESPYYLIMFVFSVGICNYNVSKCEKNNNKADGN